jgi:hydrogenase maturation protein HypF
LEVVEGPEGKERSDRGETIVINKKCRFTITVKGTVQGVGFRPFVYRTARHHSITGDVANNPSGVTIHAFGLKQDVDAFIQSLRTSAPPLALIRSFDIAECVASPAPSDFIIAESSRGQEAEIDITADTATCDACLAELFDPENRRYLHPFINCTDCGPRYTIITGLPYDRPNTTMSGFPMCDECRKEYEDPSSRRFHAQPVCCPNCGPRLSLVDCQGHIISQGDPVAAAKALLHDGKILAIKGIGGFHLACRPDKSDVVMRLRRQKHREEKPFALMVADIHTVEILAHISSEEKRLLETRERPIVILRKKNGAAGIARVIAPEIAPGLTTLGLMLPYTPVHHLLFYKSDIPALVMTSANFSDAPIVHKNKTALQTLSGIADAFLIHDRDIHVRNDDSIVRIVSGEPVIMRRSRGFVPEPLPCPCDVGSMVALGGVLKSTIAVGRNKNCYLSQYIGSIETMEDISALDTAVTHLTRSLGIKPSLYICDLHPQSFVSSYAQSTGLPVTTVQHHHAHAAACMAENEIAQQAFCIVYDGTGYGEDGKIWGSEFLHATYSGYDRLGHMSYLVLPGGDEAIRNPARIALASLFSAIGDTAVDAFPGMPEEEKNAVLDMVKSNTNCVLSCGMGRLFDAVSALLGICVKRTYEGQPAIMLEGAADPSEQGSYGSPLSLDENGISIDAQAMLCELYDDFKNGTPVSKIAARFHTTLAHATAAAAAIASQQCNCTTVCLSGGVFQNALLVERLLPLLKQANLTPVLHRRTPPNDECISYGQVVVAGARKYIK